MALHTGHVHVCYQHMNPPIVLGFALQGFATVTGLKNAISLLREGSGCYVAENRVVLSNEDAVVGVNYVRPPFLSIADQ